MSDNLTMHNVKDILAHFMDYNVGEGDNMIQKYLCLMMTVNFIFHVIAWKKYINNWVEKGKIRLKNSKSSCQWGIV